MFEHGLHLQVRYKARISDKLLCMCRCIDPDEDRVALVLGGYYSGSNKNVEVYTTYGIKGIAFVL